MVQFFSSPERNVVKTFKKFFFFSLKIGNMFLLSALLRGGFPLSRNFSSRTRVNKTETVNGRSRVYVKVEPLSTFTFVRGLSYIASISFTHVKFTCVRTGKLRHSGNQLTDKRREVKMFKTLEYKTDN